MNDKYDPVVLFVIVAIMVYGLSITLGYVLLRLIEVVR